MNQVVVVFWPLISEDADDGEAFMEGFDAVTEYYEDMEEFEVKKRKWDHVDYEIRDEDGGVLEPEKSGDLEPGRYRLNGDKIERYCKRGRWKDYEEYLMEMAEKEARGFD